MDVALSDGLWIDDDERKEVVVVIELRSFVVSLMPSPALRQLHSLRRSQLIRW